LGTLGWTKSLSQCPTITYNLYNTGTTTTPDTIFTLGASDIIVQTTTGDTTKVNTYVLDLVGQAGAYGQTIVTITVNVEDECTGVVITPTTWTSPQSYDIWSGTTLTLGTLGWSKDLS
jgi:hypothetical protein